MIECPSFRNVTRSSQYAALMWFARHLRSYGAHRKCPCVFRRLSLCLVGQCIYTISPFSLNPHEPMLTPFSGRSPYLSRLPLTFAKLDLPADRCAGVERQLDTVPVAPSGPLRWQLSLVSNQQLYTRIGSLHHLPNSVFFIESRIMASPKRQDDIFSSSVNCTGIGNPPVTACRVCPPIVMKPHFF